MKALMAFLIGVLLTILAICIFDPSFCQTLKHLLVSLFSSAAKLLETANTTKGG